MKTRFGYVSNSSSSSFVVIGDECAEKPFVLVEWKLRNELSRCVEYGLCQLFWYSERCFGRQIEDYHLLGAKWNWLVMQAYYGKSQGDSSFVDTLDEFVKGLGFDGVDWMTVEGSVEDFASFIDHQSVDPKWTFDEVGKCGIGEFLMDERCFVHNGDDEPPDDKCD